MSYALPSLPFPPKVGQVFAWDGTKLEPVASIRATRDKIGMWGVEPVLQPSGATQAAPAAYVTGAFGLNSDANMQALYDLVVAMRTAMVASGAMKGSA